MNKMFAIICALFISHIFASYPMSPSGKKRKKRDELQEAMEEYFSGKKFKCDNCKQHKKDIKYAEALYNIFRPKRKLALKYLLKQKGLNPSNFLSPFFKQSLKKANPYLSEEEKNIIIQAYDDYKAALNNLTNTRLDRLPCFCQYPLAKKRKVESSFVLEK